MSLAPTPFSRRRLLSVSLFCCALILIGAPVRARAATASADAGVRLLQAQLPAGTAIPQTTCDQLARAVGRATLTHRGDAPSILAAALAKDSHRSEARRPCACVVRIFRNSLAAAPSQASALLETASSLYPECADDLAAALDRANDKNVVDDKNGPALRQVSNDKHSGDTFDPNVRNLGEDGDPNDPDLSGRDISGLGFGGGFGSGFPGSPGFIGSAPSGGVALPQPVQVTSVVNG